MADSESQADRVFDIFSRVRRVAETERHLVLDEACGTDQAVRRDVERLLEGLDRSPQFLEPQQALPPVHYAVGDRIGSYTLNRILGEGAYGVVFSAAQDVEAGVSREVALKVLRPLEGVETATRQFHGELRALAHTNHEGIARLLDAGMTDRGDAYLVTELVHGVPIDLFCDEFRIPIRERLRLLAEACHAVHHAHRRGYLHRDLKPANMLVEKEEDRELPKIKIVDFGVALAFRDLDPKAEFRAILGTPRYMSPEHLRGQADLIDIRSDVWSLGVVLFELLVGRSPYANRGGPVRLWDVIERQSVGAMPDVWSVWRSYDRSEQSRVASFRGEPLGAMTHWLRGELGAIVRMATAMDPTERYDTAAALAEDVQDYLAGNPVRAYRGNWAYRTTKAIRRNPVVSFAGAALGLALVVLCGVLWAASQRIREAHLETERRMTGVVEVLRETVGQFSRQPQQDPDSIKFAAEMGERYREALDAIDVLPETPELQLEVARAAIAVAGMKHSMGEPLDVGLFERSLVTIDGLCQEFPESPEYRAAFVNACFGYGWRRFRDGDAESGQRWLRRALHESHHRIIRFSKKVVPISAVESELTVAELQLGNVTAALELAERNLARSAAEARDNGPGADPYRLANAHARLVGVSLRMNRFAAAQEHARTAAQLIEAEEVTWLHWHIWTAAASADLSAGNRPALERWVQRLDEYTAVAQTQAPDFQLDDQFATIEYLRAEAMLMDGRRDRAAEALRQAVNFQEREYTQAGKTRVAAVGLGSACARLAYVLYDDGHLDESHAWFQRARSYLERALEGGRATRCVHAYVAFHCHCPFDDLRDLDAAAVFAEPWRESTDVAIQQLLGILAVHQGQFDEAIVRLERACRDGNGGDALDWYFLARSFRESGRRERAAYWWDRIAESERIYVKMSNLFLREQWHALLSEYEATDNEPAASGALPAG